MEKEEQVNEQPHPVKLAINAKGKFSGEVKCYGKTPEEAMKSATAQAKILETMIQDKNKE